jgi:tryptophan synthase alpha subunit
MIGDGYTINKREEVATATKVKWWVKDGVVVGVEIVPECLI